MPVGTPYVVQLYDALIQALRDADAGEGREFLKRFLQQPQLRADVNRQDVIDLALTDGPFTIVDRPAVTALQLLRFLKVHVGWTEIPELKAITDRLSETDLRKLISLSIAFWKERSTEIGLVNAIRLLTGKRALVHNWFYYRTILGETITGEEQLGYDNWIIGGAVTRFDEFTSTIRIMDDGQLDEQLIVDLIELARASSERVELYLVDFLDMFDGALDQWTVPFGMATIDETNKVFVLQPGVVANPIVPIAAPSAFTKIVLIQKIKLGDGGDILGIDFFSDGTNFYNLEITGGTWTLSRFSPGGTAIGSFAPPAPFVSGVWYKIRIVVERSGTNNAIKIYMDAALAFSLSESTAAVTGGKFAYNTNGGNAQNTELDNVEFFRTPLRQALIEPSGTTPSSNFFG